MSSNSLHSLAEQFGIGLIYLFGSQYQQGRDFLQGRPAQLDDPLADLDIGIVLKAGLPHSDAMIKVYADIYNALDELFNPFSVDLTFLEENHSVFQANAICGVCIYSFDEAFRGQYEENVLRRAADFKPFLDKYLQEYMEEVLQGDR